MNQRISKKLQKGFFIVFEGIDGSGKTTQTLLLKEFFDSQGYECVLLREPTDGGWGKKIKNLLKNGRKGTSPKEELNLFIEDRKENLKKNILPALKNNKIIVQDRYYYSTIAYQGALGMDPQEIREKNEAFALKPDLVFYLAIKPESGLERIDDQRKEKRDAFEKERYLKEVNKKFDSFTDSCIMRIDATLPQDLIQKKVQEICMNKMPQLVP